jgi:hypothetical protein
LYSQDADKLETEDICRLIEDCRQEIEFYSLEEFLDVEVNETSRFTEDKLVIASTASGI